MLRMRKLILQRAIYVAVLLSLVASTEACKPKPPNLDPVTTKMWQADQVLIALGEISDVAQGLNAVQKCDPPGTATCQPLLSTHNTRITLNIIESAVNTIHAVPSGWKATATAALGELDKQLDEAGKTSLKAYVEAARQVINGLM